jgi:hypothetical protein
MHAASQSRRGCGREQFQEQAWEDHQLRALEREEQARQLTELQAAIEALQQDAGGEELDVRAVCEEMHRMQRQIAALQQPGSPNLHLTRKAASPHRQPRGEGMHPPHTGLVRRREAMGDAGERSDGEGGGGGGGGGNKRVRRGSWPTLRTPTATGELRVALTAGRARAAEAAPATAAELNVDLEEVRRAQPARARAARMPAPEVLVID